MSDETIRKGDLVMIVKPAPCGCDNGIGIVYRVQSIRESRRPYCVYCGVDLPTESIAVFPGGGGAGICRLKKINPPSLDETRTTDEELTV